MEKDKNEDATSRSTPTPSNPNFDTDVSPARVGSENFNFSIANRRYGNRFAATSPYTNCCNLM